MIVFLFVEISTVLSCKQENLKWENKKIRQLRNCHSLPYFLCLPYIFPLLHIFHSTFEYNFAQLLFHPKNYFIKSLNLKSFFWNFFFFCEMSFRKVKVCMNDGNLLNYNSVVVREEEHLLD